MSGISNDSVSRLERKTEPLIGSPFAENAKSGGIDRCSGGRPGDVIDFGGRAVIIAVKNIGPRPLPLGGKNKGEYAGPLRKTVVPCP
jgi:hypothetical protein